MVFDYYHLREEPFGVTPDPRYLYSSATHREALASVLYGVEAGRGFVALIAKPGMGKTMLLFHALNRLREKARTVFLFQTICTPTDFLRALLADLGIHETQASLIELQAKLNEILAEQSRSGKPLVVVVDEAQNLDDAVLELVRTLSNFETPQAKLMQIILCGQPQLADKLASSNLEQLRQRISIIAQLEPFSSEETRLYVQHRLRIAGYVQETPLFTESALALVATRSEGIPRNINNLCFNALSLGYALKRKIIDTDIILEVLGDLDLNSLRERNAAPVPSAPVSEPPARRLAHAAIEPPNSRSRILKFGVAAIVLICLGWALPRIQRGKGKRLEVQASVAAPALAVAARSADPLVSAPSPAPVGSIRVREGETLYQICRDQFSSCSSQDIQQIRRLNPWLSDPDHIEAGQTIRVPLHARSTAGGLSVAGQSNSAFPREAGKL